MKDNRTSVPGLFIGQRPVLWAAVCLAAVSLVLHGIDFLKPSVKIAYVRSNELIYSYIGMKEADNTLKEKTQMWQANIDTLQRDFEQALNEYNQEYNRYTKQEHTDRQMFLQKQQENLEQYKQAIQVKVQEEQQQITQGILNQINSFVAEYGRQHGYTVILGTTSDGSVLYGEDAVDITKELLTQLNGSYKRKQ